VEGSVVGEGEREDVQGHRLVLAVWVGGEG
jgi:hypothetical protein